MWVKILRKGGMKTMESSLEQKIQSGAHLPNCFLQMRWGSGFPGWHPLHSRLHSGSGWGRAGRGSRAVGLRAAPTGPLTPVRHRRSSWEFPGPTQVWKCWEKQQKRILVWDWKKKATEGRNLVTSNDSQVCCYQQQVAPKAPWDLTGSHVDYLLLGQMRGTEGKAEWDTGQRPSQTGPLSSP